MPHQPTHKPNPHHGRNNHEPHPQNQRLEIPPLDPRLPDPGFLAFLHLRRFVQVGDIFKVESCFFSQAVLAVDDDGPEDLAEGLSGEAVSCAQR